MSRGGPRGPRDGRRTGRAGPGRGGPDGARRRGGAERSGPARPCPRFPDERPGLPREVGLHFSRTRGVRGGGSPLCAPPWAPEAPGPRRPLRPHPPPAAGSAWESGAQVCGPWNSSESRGTPPEWVHVPAELIWRAWGVSSDLEGFGVPGHRVSPFQLLPTPPCQGCGETACPSRPGLADYSGVQPVSFRAVGLRCSPAVSPRETGPPTLERFSGCG